MTTPHAPVFWVPRHIDHHGAHSGYDRLFEHMRLPQAASPWGRRLARAMPRAMAWRLWQLRPQPTQAAGLEAELGAMPAVMGGGGRIVHFIYGEDTYCFTPLWKRGANRVLATFHYPPARLATRVNPGSLRALDAAVIVGENQRAWLRELLPDDRIHFVPHAVDTDFFCPADHAPGHPDIDGPPRIVCAGSLFRDHATLLAVHRGLRAGGIDVETLVIGPSAEQQALLHAEPGVRVLRGLSDEALRDTYRSATVGVLPLTDATANNALLEMMACGRPVVVSGVGGLPGYVAGSAVHVVPAGDSARMTELASSLIVERDRRHAEATMNRAHAVGRLSLLSVADRLRAVYRALGIEGSAA